MSSDATVSDWWLPVLMLASFAFLLHFVWEMLQVPLYAGMATMAHWAGVVTCVKATAGDVVIALSAYATAAGIGRGWHWYRDTSPKRIAIYLVAGVAITVILEGLNVYVWHRWSYSPAMPLILGIGVSPLLQWVIVPPLALWLMQRHIAGRSRRLDAMRAAHVPSLSPY